MSGNKKAAKRAANSDVSPFLVPRAGFEPATLGLEVLCSIQLSYRGDRYHYTTSRRSCFIV